MTYWGTGNGSPWFGDQRPGDNLYTSSTLALDPDTGKIKGHFQYQWNESWDWDEMNAPMLIDFQKDGQEVKGLFIPARNGYLYWLERSNRRHQVPGCQSIREAECLQEHRSEDRPADLQRRTTSLAPASTPTSARRCGAARTGRMRPTTRRPA